MKQEEASHPCDGEKLAVLHHLVVSGEVYEPCTTAVEFALRRTCAERKRFAPRESAEESMATVATRREKTVSSQKTTKN
jgi:hypothetical protein